jgi:hypothetical protein
MEREHAAEREQAPEIAAFQVAAAHPEVTAWVGAAADRRTASDPEMSAVGVVEALVPLATGGTVHDPVVEDLQVWAAPAACHAAVACHAGDFLAAADFEEAEDDVARREV